MASSFASAVNGWQAQGRTAAGTAGAALLSGNTAAGLAVTTSDPAAIAAASTDGTANGNLLALPALRGADGVEKRWSALVSDQGLMVQTATSESNVASARADSTAATRDAASAVDLDTEAAELVRYQQAYSGAAKVIQVARDTMQSILDLF
jgi:flagellar hook-associated protein 1 FlgK